MAEKETLNMLSTSVSRFAQEIEWEIKEGNYLPAIGIGLSGVGKTMAIGEMAHKLGIGYKELRLVTLTETDMLGSPLQTKADGTVLSITEQANADFVKTTYASNDLLPIVERDGEEGILVLDEITSASAPVRAAAFQLLDSSRRLGNYKLPDKWKIVALGNGPDDGGVFAGLESAFLSRNGGTCYRIECDLKSWKRWATEHNVHEAITAFLSFDQDSFYQLYEDSIASVFPCPRSWTALSTKLKAREKMFGKLLTEEQVIFYAAGAVGVKVASKFGGFYRYMHEIAGKVDAEDIVSGKAVTEVGSVPSRKFKCDALEGLAHEAVYVAIESVSKVLKDMSKDPAGNEFDEDTVVKPEAKQFFMGVANVMKWALALADKRMDWAISVIQEVQNNVPAANCATMSNEFDEILPEYAAFAVANRASFMTGGRRNG